MSGELELMKNNIFIWFVFIFILLPGLCLGQDQTELIPDGFMFSGAEGAEGKVFYDDAKRKWFFELLNDVNDSFNIISANTRLQLLPSAALEKLCSDVNERIKPNYRLWGRVTKYKNQNFVFTSHFFPLAKTHLSEPEIQPETKSTVDEEPKKDLSINEPEDAVIIPTEVLKKLSGRKIIRTETVQERFDIEADTIISNRMAFLMKTSEEDFVFVLESLGRNVSEVSLKVLPSQALELAEEIQNLVSDGVRFKISGLLTKYKGEYYLLLQRASRVYSYQNFAR
jgi:hypothetical protein